MKKLLILFGFACLVFGSQNVGFGKNKKDSPMYSVQLFSERDMPLALESLEKVPKEFKQGVSLYKVADFIKGRYSKSVNYNDMKEHLKKLKDAGYKDAFIAESTLLKMEDEIVKEGVAQKTSTPVKPKEKMLISKLEKSNMLQKATEAYKNGDEIGAMIYYETLFISGDKNEKIKNNLCYLYGKKGAWSQAKKVIDEEFYPAKFIYAYANGAVENNQDNYYADLSEYISLDKSGRLALLSGYYYEKREDLKKAAQFYKMAYDKNPSDAYNIFVYARILDIQNNKITLEMYKKVLSKTNDSHPLHGIVYKRIKELEGENG